MTLWCLGAAIPGGVVAPCIVLGALLGRIYAQLLPEWPPGAPENAGNVAVKNGEVHGG